MRSSFAPLNVLIGPNGSGKSNFIEAIGLLRALPSDWRAPLRRSGGATTWVWKGIKAGGFIEIEARVDCRGAPLMHHLVFEQTDHGPELGAERLLREDRSGDEEPAVFYRGLHGVLYIGSLGERHLMTPEDEFNPLQSVLAQRKDPVAHPDLTTLGEAYSAIRLYRDWTFGRGAPPRQPQPADLPSDHLSESADNLALVLNRFRDDLALKKTLIEELRPIFEGARDFSVQVFAGMIQLVLEEERWTIPAARLSDGTVRWLSLLAVLLDPSPPPLVCLEEPELGLHPDLIPTLARLLREASERMQLVVTTHSEVLVDCFTKTPEVVLVCEREAGSTRVRRLALEPLAEWLERYTLGQLWSKGEIGGNRW